MGPPTTMKVYRDGSKAVIDNTFKSGPGGRVRSYYDLQTKRTASWDLDDPAPQCSVGGFGGDWGDPFAMSADLNRQLSEEHSTPAGSETVNGMATRIFESANPGGGGKLRVWVDAKYGLMLKLQTAGAGPPQTMLEIKEVSFAKPPASLFAIPAGCAQAFSAPPPPTEAERIAAETGGKAGDFSSAITPPASHESCTVRLRVVHAGSMQPVTGGFQVAIDRTVDPEHMPHYTIGVGTTYSFSGGGLREVTAQLQQGTLRIENAPAQFYLDTAFGSAGEASGLIYRQCGGPESVLLLVLKNPQHISDGADWLWAKSGKFAQ